MEQFEGQLKGLRESFVVNHPTAVLIIPKNMEVYYAI